MVSIATIAEKANAGEPVTMVNAYDSSMARLVDRSDVEMILVGDSVGLTTLGYDSTSRVSIEEMIHHAAAVTRVVEETPVVVDLPFGSYNVTSVDAVRNANRLRKDGRADAIKLEGGREVAECVASITEGGIPVIGYIGVTPQTTTIGDDPLPGRTATEAGSIRDDAIALDEAGAVGTVLELVTTTAASAVTEAIDGMTIGIGAGSGCNAQVVTLHDLLGLGEVLPETAAGIGTDLGTAIVEHLNGFHGAVASGEFPDGNATEPMAEDDADDFARDT